MWPKECPTILGFNRTAMWPFATARGQLFNNAFIPIIKGVIFEMIFSKEIHFFHPSWFQPGLGALLPFFFSYPSLDIARGPGGPLDLFAAIEAATLAGALGRLMAHSRT